MSFIATIMLDILLRASTLKKSTVKVLVKIFGIKCWIFSEKKFEDSLILKIKRGGGYPGGGGEGAYFSRSNFVPLREKNIGKQGLIEESIDHSNN